MHVEYCKRCGGVTQISYGRTPLANPMPETQGLMPPLVFLLCPGHPAEKHDGHLGEDAFVSLTDSCANIYQIDGDFISLTTKQALSLLAWLRQEEQALKQLAKEQEANDD